MKDGIDEQMNSYELSAHSSAGKAPEMGSVWANRAQCWLKLGDHEKALADAKKCSEAPTAFTRNLTWFEQKSEKCQQKLAETSHQWQVAGFNEAFGSCSHLLGQELGMLNCWFRCLEHQFRLSDFSAPYWFLYLWQRFDDRRLVKNVHRWSGFSEIWSD